MIFSLVTVFGVKCVLSDVSIVTCVLFWLPFLRIRFSIPSFSGYVPLKLTWVSFKQSPSGHAMSLIGSWTRLLPFYSLFFMCFVVLLFLFSSLCLWFDVFCSVILWLLSLPYIHHLFFLCDCHRAYISHLILSVSFTHIQEVYTFTLPPQTLLIISHLYIYIFFILYLH
jgi:hypothetical protein